MKDMKNLLLPRSFRIIGWILFIPGLLLGALIFFEIWQVSFPADCFISDVVVNDTVVIGISLGSLFLVCSKEPVEDEMTQSIRLSSLLHSLYAYIAILVATTLFVDGEEYLNFMSLNLVLFPLLFIFHFQLEMRHYYRINRNEEQD